MLLADLEAATVDWVPNFDASVVRRGCCLLVVGASSLPVALLLLRLCLRACACWRRLVASTVLL